MNTKLSNVLTGIVLVASVTTMTAIAQPTMSANEHLDSVAPMTHEGAGQKQKRMLKRMARHLALTDEQVSQIKVIRSEAKTAREANKSVMDEFRSQIKSLMTNESFDEAAFTALHTQYQAALTEQAVLKAKTKHAIFQVLTEEQQIKAQNMRKKHRGIRL
ncbi:Spy/CpxP family protein refolding chaperone [Thalassotalea fusca]